MFLCKLRLSCISGHTARRTGVTSQLMPKPTAEIHMANRGTVSGSVGAIFVMFTVVVFLTVKPNKINL